MQSKAKVVIVGAGFGGLSAARELGDSTCSVTLIDRNNYHLFQPLLYQVATAALSPAEIAMPVRSVLRNKKNVEVLMAEVTGIDAVKKVVRLASGHAEPFDFLIVATGARHGYFGHDEWEQFAPGLKSIEDATRMRSKILSAFEKAETEQDSAKRASLMTFVIVGGGPTGAELAGAIAELARSTLRSDFRRIDPKEARVLLVEAGPRILNAFPEHLARRAKAALTDLGVEVRELARVENISADGVHIKNSHGSEFLPSKTVLWAAGVLPTPVASWLQAEKDAVGRVLVNPDLTVPNHESIFVIGDVANVKDEAGKPLPGVAPVALQQGHYVAHAIQRKLSGRKILPFRYRDKGNLATIGRSFAIADFGTFKISGLVAWLLWCVVHILYLVGFKNRVLVTIQWLWAYFTFQRGTRIITYFKD